MKKNDKSKKNVLVFCGIVGTLFIILLILSLFDYMYVSATMIMGCLELFGICYYIRNDKEKKYLLYGLFFSGLILFIGSIIYLMMRII